MATVSVDAPSDIAVKTAPLSAEQREWVERAWALIDEERIRRIDLELTRIPSPTGYERAVSERLAQIMTDAGLDAAYQPMDENSGNAYGYVRGSGEGPSLMVYAPIDAHLDGDPALDAPWAAPRLTDEMKTDAYVAENGDVIGLCAFNPKGFATVALAAAQAVKEAGVPLKGDLIAAFAGGGMPAGMPAADARQGHGLGSGVTYMLNHGVSPDYAIIIKPGASVAWEEAGLCWFKVTVRGQMGYAGLTRTIPGFRNSVLHAATFIHAIDEWLIDYQARNASGTVAPQGCVAAVRGGWPHKPAFPSAATEVYIDVRLTPRQTTAEVKAEFAAAVESITARHPELSVEWEMTASYPAVATDPDNWIIQSCMRGWQEVEGKEHHAGVNPVSGQHDGSAIRRMGIPTAKIGPGPVPTIPPEWRGFGGMGVAHIPDLAVAAKKIVYAVIDTCTRTRAETTG